MLTCPEDNTAARRSRSRASEFGATGRPRAKVVSSADLALIAVSSGELGPDEAEGRYVQVLTMGMRRAGAEFGELGALNAAESGADWRCTAGTAGSTDNVSCSRPGATDAGGAVIGR